MFLTMSKVDFRYVCYLLSNEDRIKKELEYFFQEGYGTSYDKEDVDIFLDNNRAVDSLIKKLEDRDYVFKKRSVECVERLRNEISLFEWNIICMKFRRHYTSERIGREVHYSRSYVDNIIFNCKNRLLELVREVEKEVYSSCD